MHGHVSEASQKGSGWATDGVSGPLVDLSSAACDMAHERIGSNSSQLLQIPFLTSHQQMHRYTKYGIVTNYSPEYEKLSRRGEASRTRRAAVLISRRGNAAGPRRRGAGGKSTGPTPRPLSLCHERPTVWSFQEGTPSE